MKRIISLLLILAICIPFCPIVNAEKRDFSEEEYYAFCLRELGIFKGVSDTFFDLERAPTRTEALIMLIRVLGKENEVLTEAWNHPFDDVPSWATNYVGYAYSKGLTKGLSETKFGEGNANAAMYLTFVLRALGYSDTNGEDFTWDNPFDLAKTKGLISEKVDLNNFLRADVVLVSYNALFSTLNGTELTLAEKLFYSGVLAEDAFNVLLLPQIQFPDFEYILSTDVVNVKVGDTTEIEFDHTDFYDDATYTLNTDDTDIAACMWADVDDYSFPWNITVIGISVGVTTLVISNDILDKTARVTINVTEQDDPTRSSNPCENYGHFYQYGYYCELCGDVEDEHIYEALCSFIQRYGEETEAQYIIDFPLNDEETEHFHVIYVKETDMLGISYTEQNSPYDNDDYFYGCFLFIPKEGNNCTFFASFDQTVMTYGSLNSTEYGPLTPLVFEGYEGAETYRIGFEEVTQGTINDIIELFDDFFEIYFSDASITDFGFESYFKLKDLTSNTSNQPVWDI